MKGWRPLRRLAAGAAALGGLAVCTACLAQGPGPAALFLVGEDWIGRWQDGAIATSTDLPSASTGSIVADGRGSLWLLAWPDATANAADANKAQITRRSAATLDAAPLDRSRLDSAATDVSMLWPAPVAGRIVLVRTTGRSVEAAMLDAASLTIDGAWRSLPLDAVRPRLLAGRWLAPAPMLVGIDSDPAIDPAQLIDAEGGAGNAAPAWLRAPASLIAVSRRSALVLGVPGKVQVVALDDGRVLSERSVAAREARQLRGALSPDGGTAILFVRPANGADRWPGVAWVSASGKALPSDGLFVDSGAGRELGQARSLACLLPGGAGAIFTLLGQPADRSSEAVLFDGAKSRRFELATGYVQRCVLGDEARQ